MAIDFDSLEPGDLILAVYAQGAQPGSDTVDSDADFSIVTPVGGMFIRLATDAEAANAAALVGVSGPLTPPVAWIGGSWLGVPIQNSPGSTPVNSGSNMIQLDENVWGIVKVTQRGLAASIIAAAIPPQA